VRVEKLIIVGDGVAPDQIPKGLVGFFYYFFHKIIKKFDKKFNFDIVVNRFEIEVKKIASVAQRESSPLATA